MLKIDESGRSNGGSDLICECGKKVSFAMHWDFIEGTCSCGKQYAIKTQGNIWNCCSGPENSCNYSPNGIQGIPEQFKHMERNLTKQKNIWDVLKLFVKSEKDKASYAIYQSAFQSILWEMEKLEKNPDEI